MKLTPGREILAEAAKSGYAVGAFNFNNIEFLQAIVDAAIETMTPVFLATSEGAVKYAGLGNIVALADAAAGRCPVPLCLHLDHGRDLDLIRDCIDAGYTSVMIDASDLPFEQNIEKTAMVTRLAHPKGVSVEAELGRLVGIEDNIKVAERDAVLVNPEQAGEFVQRTGIDSLAPAVGTAHGAFKFKGEPKLDIARLEKVREATDGLPLVLHGASSVPSEVLKACREAGMKIPGAKGVPEDQLRRAISAGICKVNTDTDLRLAFTAAVRTILNREPGEFDPRNYLGPGRDSVREQVLHRIRLLRKPV